MCNIEFPHFGASYPDAHCIDGYLWDMDSYENGCYTIGGDDPCPFCNTEEWLKTVLDNEEFASREEALEWVEKMREKWGAEHRGSSEIPKDLEEAAEKHATDYDSTIWCVLESSNQKTIWKREHKETYIAGAKWQYQKDRAEFAKLKAKEWSDGYDEGITKGKEQMLKEAVEADVNFYGDIVAGKKWAEFVVEMPTKNLSDKVRIIIVKED